MYRPKWATAMVLIAFSMVFIACDDDDGKGDPTTPGSGVERFFVLEVSASDGGTTAGSNALLVVPDIESGTASITEAVELPPSAFVRKNLLNTENSIFVAQFPNKFLKFELDEDNQLVETASAPKGETISRPSVWIDEDRFFITGDNFNFEVFDYRSFTNVGSGQLEEPVAEGRDAWAGVSFLHNDKIYLGYGDINNTTFSDTLVGFMVLDKETQAVEKILKDYRTVGPGQPNTNETFSENGYTYFMAMPSAWWYNRPLKPSAIMRIDPTGEIDPDFFFNISETLGGLTSNETSYKYHTDGIFHYLGDGKFLVRVTDEDKIVDYSDYYDPSNGVYAKEHYIADINNGTMTKLDVPESFAAYENMIEFDNKVAFVLNTADGAFLYIYNKDTGEVKQGLKVEGAKTINTIKVITNE